MSFTAGEDNLSAEGNRDGSASHGDEHADGLKMTPHARRTHNGVKQKRSHHLKILELGKTQRNCKKILFGRKRLVEIPATKQHLLLLGPPAPLCCVSFS